MDFKNINVAEHIRNVAKSKGISIDECKYEMEKAIKNASENPSDLFVKAFGKRTPDVDEFICKMLNMIVEEQEKVNRYEA